MSTAPPVAPSMLLRGGLWCDGAGPPRPGTLVLENGRISTILAADLPAHLLPPDHAHIDLSGHLITPGLIDCHTHMLMVGNMAQDWGYERELLRDALPLRTLRAAAHARLALDHGFTTVRDVCTEGAAYADVSLREAIDAGICEGPNLQPSGPGISITGGYLPGRMAPGVCVPTGCSICDGVDEIRREVRRQVSFGVSWIKVFADWGCRHAVTGTMEMRPTFSRVELAALVEEAGLRGRRVAAHVMSDEWARLAIECGVASLEHLGQLSVETLELAAARDVTLVPTLSVAAYIAEHAPESWRPWARKQFEKLVEPFRRALAAGTRIACGSDIGAYPHAAGALSELELMMDFGMAPLDVLKAATGTAATLLGLTERGKIAEGMIADLCVFPLSRGHVDLRRTLTAGKPSLVLKAGRLVRGTPRQNLRQGWEAQFTAANDGAALAGAEPDSDEG